MEIVKKKVIIVGAGIGGTAVAARLALAGLDVSVYEKNCFSGGKCSTITHEGYRFDQGPSILLMTEIFEETFRDLGSSFSQENIELLKCAPNCSIWFEDGNHLTTSTDLAHMNHQLQKFEGLGWFRNFISFLAEAKSHYDQSLIHVLRKDFPGFISLLRPAFLPYLFKLHPFQSSWRRICCFFKSVKVRQAFSLESMYLGMSPANVPGTYTLLQYAGLVGGVWYPRGGFHQIVKALLRIGLEHRVNYHFAAEVQSITVVDQKVCGIRLKSGEFVQSDAVVINADLLYAYKDLLPRDCWTDEMLKRSEQASCSTISFYWSLSKQFPQLETHNMFVNGMPDQKNAQIFMTRHGPFTPSFYVHVPSRIDPSAAPPGTDSVTVLVLVENSGGEYTDRSQLSHAELNTLVAQARRHVISSIENRCSAIGFGDSILHEIINSPFTWKQTFNCEKGAVFGLNHSFFNLLAFRPKIKHQNLDSLYFVGGSTHPGAGVPTCLASAKLSAARVLNDLRLPSPWGNEEQVDRIGLIRILPWAFLYQSAVIITFLILAIAYIWRVFYL